MPVRKASPEDQYMRAPIETTILRQAISITSSEGKYSFGRRQLWYQLNNGKANHVKIDWPDFQEVIADFEKRHGQIPGLLPPETAQLDERGWPMHVATLTHPDGKVEELIDYPTGKTAGIYRCKYCYSAHDNWWQMSVEDNEGADIILCGQCGYTSLRANAEI